MKKSRFSEEQIIGILLPDADRAVIAAGHLHIVMEGFSQACTEGRVNYLCLLNTAAMPGSEIAASDFSSLAGGIDSGTVLIAGDLCDAMRALPGVALRPLDYAPRSAVLANQQIAELVRSPEFTELLREVSVLETPVAKAPAISVAEAVWSSEQVVETHLPLRKLYWTIAGTAVACVLAGAVAIGVFARRSTAPVAAPAVNNTTAPDGLPLSTPQAATPPAHSRVSPVDKVKEGVLTNGNTLREVKKSGPPRELLKKPERTKTEVQGRAPSPGGALTFDRSEIPRMNAMAERAAGDGNYDRAITIFQSVLRNDPSNFEARRELDKAIRNKASQSK